MTSFYHCYHPLLLLSAAPTILCCYLLPSLSSAAICCLHLLPFHTPTHSCRLLLSATVCCRTLPCAAVHCWVLLYTAVHAVCLSCVLPRAQWEEEARKHTPGLRVLVYYGADRQRLDAQSITHGYDLVITSYGAPSLERVGRRRWRLGGEEGKEGGICHDCT